MSGPARKRIERSFHVSFKLPEQATKELDEYRAEIRAECAAEIRAAQHSALSWDWNWQDGAEIPESCAKLLDPDRPPPCPSVHQRMMLVCEKDTGHGGPHGNATGNRYGSQYSWNNETRETQ